MKGLAMALLAALALATAAPVAAAGLSKAGARNEALVVAIEFATRKTWPATPKVGACRRLSAERVDCDARATGDELVGCQDFEPYDCEYVFHSCRFTVAVHLAGWEAVGRVADVRCRTRPHSG